MKKIKLAFTKLTLPVSVTGRACALNCKHCGGHYLEHMMPLSKVFEEGVIPAGTKSLLVSGGSTLEGKVPILNRIDEIKSLESKGYKLNFHVGLVDEKEAIEISKIADAISFDFVGDDETIHYVYNLKKKVGDYVRTFEILRRYTKNVYPHITIGLNCGKIGHEYKAIDILSHYRHEKIVFIVFIPTLHTAFEECPTPSINDIRKIFKYARKKLSCELILGCMYPGGKLRDEIGFAAIDSDFNTITQPSSHVIERLERENYLIEWSDECCVL